MANIEMSGGEAACVMVDTNTLMHFQRLDQIDWPSLLGRNFVYLLITPTLLREMEEQKVKNRSKRLRDRVQSLVQWIAQHIDSETPVEIRTGVYLLFIRHSPTIDFAAHRLSPSVSDDEFIAHAVEFKREYGREVTFFTADTGMRLKLPAHGFKALQPSTELRLQDEPDETEKENAKLKAELSRHINRIPRLELTFLAGDVKFSLKTARLEIDEAKPRAPHPYGMTSQYSYTRYRKDFDEWKEAARFSTGFQIRLENNGTAIATNISLVLTFPDFVLAKQLKEQPRVPNSFDLPSHYTRSSLRSPDEPSYSDEFDTVSFDLNDLVHNRAFESDLVWLRFKADHLIKNFSADYEITCIELIKPIQGSLHFTVEEWLAVIRGSKDAAE